MISEMPSNSYYLPPTEFYGYGASIITRLHTVTRGECIRVIYPGRSYFVTDNTLWGVVEDGDDHLTVITAEEFATQVKARDGSLEDIYPEQR
jgi:hypothetical protein